MDYEKFVEEIIDGPLGELIRERFVQGLIEDLETPSAKPDHWTQEEYEAEEWWAVETVKWLRENY